MTQPKIRAGILALLVLAGLGVWTTSASATSCFGGSPYSALNQYCESIPTSSGGQPSTGGSGTSGGGSTLRHSLPPRVVRQISGAAPSSAAQSSHAASTSAKSRLGSASHRRSRRTGGTGGTGGKSGTNAKALSQLLSLPAASTPRKSVSLQAADTADVWQPFGWLIGVLAALAVLLAGFALVVARRRPSGNDAT